MTVMPRIQHAKTRDGIDIAYYSIGRGAPLLCLPWAAISHLEREWQYREQRHWCKRLAARRRVIRLDHRGTGLSDRRAELAPQGGLDDIEAVVRQEGLQRFTLLGQLHSAATAMLYAAVRPEKVSRLVLWSPFASYRELLDSSPPLQAARAAADKDWFTFTEILAQHATGWADLPQARRLAAYLRECAEAGTYLRGIDRYGDLDLGRKIAALTMPVLVIHRRDAAFPTVELAKRLSSAVPGSRLVLLDGAALVPFLGDTDAVATTLDQFLAATDAQPRPGGLTEREIEVLERIAGGYSNQGIARELAISTRTVERHIGNIYLKINVHNRAQATAYAIRKGLVSGVDTRSA